VLPYECGELGSGKVLEQLIEQACDLYDWIALLWAAFGEAPSQELLANVNYRRALILFQTARTCFGQEWNYLEITGERQEDRSRIERRLILEKQSAKAPVDDSIDKK